MLNAKFSSALLRSAVLRMSVKDKTTIKSNALFKQKEMALQLYYFFHFSVVFLF